MYAPSSSSSWAKRFHCGVNSVPPEKIPLMPAFRIVVPMDSSRRPSASRSFGVVNMQRMSWFASRIITAWSITWSL
ncbi:hypothetical protein D3C83_114060 [compost metagenome]